MVETLTTQRKAQRHDLHVGEHDAFDGGMHRFCFYTVAPGGGLDFQIDQHAKDEQQQQQDPPRRPDPRGFRGLKINNIGKKR